MSFVDEEFEIAMKKGELDLVGEFIPEIKSLVDKFYQSGQSGFSAPYVAECISMVVKKLCLRKPLSCIDDLDEEWIDFGDVFQNKRCSALFKEKGKRAYYLDAIVFRDGESNFSSSGVFLKDGTKISSLQFVKFPFQEKTFYVDVYEDNGKLYVTDESELEDVFKYYYDVRRDRDEKITDIIS